MYRDESEVINERITLKQSGLVYGHHPDKQNVMRTNSELQRKENKKYLQFLLLII